MCVDTYYCIASIPGRSQLRKTPWYTLSCACVKNLGDEDNYLCIFYNARSGVAYFSSALAHALSPVLKSQVLSSFVLWQTDRLC